jgi:hypothetical protein
MKTKSILGVTVLLVSCTALAADSPFETGKTYMFQVGGFLAKPYQIKEVKGKWVLLNADVCQNEVKSNECWVNSDMIPVISQPINNQ